MPSANETMLAAESAVLSIVIRTIIKDRYPIRSEFDDFVKELQKHVHAGFSEIEDPDNPEAAAIFKHRGLQFAQGFIEYISTSSGTVDDTRGLMGFTIR